MLRDRAGRPAAAGGAPAGTAAAASSADAESPAENTENTGNFRRRVEALELELAAKDERLAEVKEKAKIFVRDKLKSVQEHLLQTEQRHAK